MEGVAHIGLNRIPLRHQAGEHLVNIQRRLMIQFGEHHVFDLEHALELFIGIVVVKQLVDLKADFRVFIRVKRRNARFGRAEGFAAEALLLVLVKQHVVRHDHLGAVGNQQVRMHALFRKRLYFIEEFADIQCHAVADDVGGVLIKHPARQLMQRKFAVIVDNRMAGVAAALKTDDHIRVCRQDVGDFALALVAPVGADDRSYHLVSPPVVF